MKCTSCQVNNKETTKTCKKCGFALTQPIKLWKPTWQWHLKTLGIIYTLLIVVFFVTNWFLSPYLRDIPKEAVPWLHDSEKMH